MGPKGKKNHRAAAAENGESARPWTRRRGTAGCGISFPASRLAVPDVVIVVVIIIISIWFISLMVLHLNLPQHEQRLGPSSSLAEKMEGVLASHHRGGAAAAGLLVVFSPTTPSLRRINGRLVRLPPRGIIHNKSWRSESSAAPPAAARTLGNDNNASFAVAGAQVRRRNDKDVDPAPCYPEDLIVTSSHRSASRYRSCRPPGWSYRLFSTCNILHEIDLASMEPEGEDSYLVTRGFYRDVWAVVLAGPGARSSRNMVVLKTTRYQFDFGIQNLMDAKRDALVMERLASHPNIVDVHGHCGASTLVEAVPFQVEPYVIASSGYYHPERAGKVRDSGSGGGGLVIGNALEPRERLQMALEMAESLAVLHGYEGGTISHSDVQLSQWLRSGDDRLVLGDFHSSKIMDWNQEERQYCAYSTGTVFGNYRSPEEFSSSLLSEKVDVYSFGNNIYALLTGLWVFYDTEDDHVVHSKVRAGERAKLPDVLHSTTLEEQKLEELMKQCWEANPDQRIDIFQAVAFLRDALAATDRQLNATQ